MAFHRQFLEEKDHTGLTSDCLINFNEKTDDKDATSRKNFWITKLGGKSLILCCYDYISSIYDSFVVYIY